MNHKEVVTLEHFKTAAERLEKELETARMRLAACGVVALADTPLKAKVARTMNEEYMSASCNDVIRVVDNVIRMRDALNTIVKVAQQKQDSDSSWETVLGICLDALGGVK
jgi:hypothetical protein